MLTCPSSPQSQKFNYGYYVNPLTCAVFIRANYFVPTEWLKARGAKRTLADL